MVRARIVSVLEEGERELLHAEGDTRTKLELLMRRIWAVVGDPSMARIIKLVHGELNNFPELARFYFEEVILRVRALGLAVLAQGVAAGEVRPEQAQFAARAMPSLLVMGSKMLHFFAPLDPAPLTADAIVSGTIDLVLNGVLPRDTRDGTLTMRFLARPWSHHCLPLSPLAAQAPTLVPPGPLTLDEAMRWAWQRGVAASVARLNADVAAVARRPAPRRPAAAGGGRGGLLAPDAQPRRVRHPDRHRRHRRHSTCITSVSPARRSLVNLAAMSRVQSASDSSVAARSMRSRPGAMPPRWPGVAYVRVLGIAETIRAREADSVIAADLLSQARQLADAGISAAIDVTRNEVNLAAVRTQLVITREPARACQARPRPRPEHCRRRRRSCWPIHSARRTSGSHRPGLGGCLREGSSSRGAGRAAPYRGGAPEPPGGGPGEPARAPASPGQVQESGQQTDALAGTWAVQVGVSVPIFDGLRRQKRRDEQSARYDAQKLREYDVTQQVDAEARQVVLDLTAAREELQVAVQRLRLADLELKQADERVAAGVAGSVETTNAQRNLVGARDALIQARVSLDIARVNSYRALGIIVPANGQ